MVKKELFNPVIIAVLICIFIFYTPFFTLPERKAFASVIPKSQITALSGSLVNSPSKTSSGKYYYAAFLPEKSFSIDNAQSSASGLVSIYIPAEMAEAYFPGKLYSAAVKKGAHLWESGGHYFIYGHFQQDTFYISSCSDSYFSNDFFGKIALFRSLCRLQFKRLMYSWGFGGGLLLALLCGAREYTDFEASAAFRNAGLSHILALSGMHLSMFSGIALFFGKKIGVKNLSFIIRVIALVIFVWFAGFSPSLLRAFICSMLLLICAISNSPEPDMIIILCFSFLLQVIISPADINNAGFMLSYGALAGILVFQKSIKFLIARFLPNYLSGSLSSSAAAQIFTAPVSLKLFKSFCPIGIIATAVVSPAVTIFIYSGLLLIILSLVFPFLSEISGIFINFEYTIIKYVVSFFSRFPRINL